MYVFTPILLSLQSLHWTCDPSNAVYWTWLWRFTKEKESRVGISFKLLVIIYLTFFSISLCKTIFGAKKLKEVEFLSSFELSLNLILMLGCLGVY